MNRTNVAEFDFILSRMGYTDVPLVQRAVVFFKILQETQVPYRRYYRTHNKLRSGLTPDTVDIVTFAECDINYANYIIYLYNEKMKVIEKLNNMLVKQ